MNEKIQNKVEGSYAPREEDYRDFRERVSEGEKWSWRMTNKGEGIMYNGPAI